MEDREHDVNKGRSEDDEDDKLRETLMAEYATITRQIIHWDTFFWTKSRFFLAVEGIAILATVDRLSPRLVLEDPLELVLFWFLLGIVLLNWFLSYFWFLTGRRNRDFLNFRFERAIQIEKHRLLQVEENGVRKPLVRLYHHQETRLNSPELKGKFSHYWEISIPFVFAIAWGALLAAGVWALGDNWCIGLAVSLAAILVCLATIWIVDSIQKRWLPPETGHPPNNALERDAPQAPRPST